MFQRADLIVLLRFRENA